MTKSEHAIKFRRLLAGLILSACPALGAGELEELIKAGERGHAGAQERLREYPENQEPARGPDR